METYLFAENGEIREIKLTEGITDIFKENLLVRIATMHPTMLQFMVYASEPKDGGYSITELYNLLNIHNRGRMKTYEMDCALNHLVDYDIFDEKKLKDNELRYSMMPILAEYLVDLREEFGKGGDNFFEGVNKFCRRLLMKDGFFET